MGYVTNKSRLGSVQPAQGYTVAILTDDYITHTGGALIQTNLSGPMTSVTLSPRDSYRIAQPSGGSGITVTASGNDFVISGTPTADVTINCTTTRTPDLLTATQKDVSNWIKTNLSADYGYQHTVSDDRIDWTVSYVSGQYYNAAYYIELPISQVPAGNYILQLRYRITDLSQIDDYCRIGITSSIANTYVNPDFTCVVPILDTQTTYTTVSVPYSRVGTEQAYLAITNSQWNMSTFRKGRIYLAYISLRAV